MWRKSLLAITVILFGLGICAFSWYLPEIEVPEASVILDINGQLIKGLAEQNRIVVGREDIPNSFIQAIIAVEDKNFYSHHGVDIVGIIRAFLINVKSGKITAGGSTITQQTAKNLFLTNERTITRKLKELVYALQLERKYGKDEIITLYCNTIYFGHGAYGIEVAARTFFGKSCRDLNIAESTLLAGLPNWPNHYNPYINPEEAKKRQGAVLQRMVEEGMISEGEKREIAEQELVYKKAPYLQSDAPYFVSMVKDYLVEKYGERAVFQGGLRVYTTLDLEMQKAVAIAYSDGLKNYDPQLQAALIALDVRNGHIRALIGGRDFAKSAYNRVFSQRQPGSTFKPFMYSLAIESGLQPYDMMKCEEVTYKLPGGDTYSPKDYGREPYHWQSFTLKEAVMISDNVIAVQINDMLGPENVAQYAKRFGFKDIKPVLSLPLGSSEVTPLEMAAAYAVFPNQGIYCNPIFILRVEDKKGRVLEENRTQQRRVIEADVAYVVTDMLKGVLEPGGTGARLSSLLHRPAAGKTGTTDELKDAWFVGFTPRLSCAVWVGYDKGKNVNITGGSIAGPIWANFIENASKHIPPDDFIKPASVELAYICLDTGMIASEYCPRTIKMAFISGIFGSQVCYQHLQGVDWNWLLQFEWQKDKATLD
jgi:1A family penicillin-binding protein